MDKKKFTIEEKMKAVEAHIHEGAGCRCQESFTPYLLPIVFICYSLSYPFLFATLRPIPPWLRTIFCLSVFVKLARISALTFATTRTACKIIRPTRKAWGASRNLGKGSGESKPIRRQRVL